jgi:hypothetical protein
MKCVATLMTAVLGRGPLNPVLVGLRRLLYTQLNSVNYQFTGPGGGAV